MSISHIFLCLLVCFIWANSYIADRILILHVPPYLILTLEATIVGLITLLFIRRPQISWGKLAFISLNWVLTYSAYLTAVKLHINMNIALITSKLGVVFSAIFAVFLCKENINKSYIIGMLIAFYGIFLLKNQPNILQNPAAFGCIILYTILWGLYNTVSSRAAKQNAALALTGWVILLAAPQTLLLSYFFEDWSTLHLFSLVDLGCLLYLSIFSILISFSIWMYLLAHNPIHKVSCFSLTTSFIGIIEGYFIFHENIDKWQLVSAGLVSLGLLIILLNPENLFKAKPTIASS